MLSIAYLWDIYGLSMGHPRMKYEGNKEHIRERDST